MCTVVCLLRFVDDYFAVAEQGEQAHCMSCFARRGTAIPFASLSWHCVCCACRLVRAILGSDAIADRKLEHGNPLTVLGVSTEVTAAGVTFIPDAAKVAKWTADMEAALAENRLCAGEASKLAGMCTHRSFDSV